MISRTLMLVASVSVARMLGKTGYGELGMIQSTVGMFTVFAGFGLGLTATKHVAEFRRSDPARAGRIIGLSAVVAIVTGGLMAVGLLIFAPWLAEHTIAAPHLGGVLRVAALILFIDALNGAQTGALSGFEAFKTIAHLNLFVGLVSFPTLIIGAYLGGLNGAVWALAINLGFNWILNHIALRREARRQAVPFGIRQSIQELPILWRFSFPAVLSGALVGPAIWACNAFLVSRPGGYGEMGIFAAALVFQRLLLFASGMLNAPLLSILSNVGSAKSRKLEAVNILSSWGISLLPTVFLISFPEVVEMLFGGQYEGRSFRVAFAVVAFYTCILTYRSGLLRVLQSKSLLWLGFCNNLLWAAVLLPTAFVLVRWGAVGLAISFAISYVFNSIVFVPIYMRFGGVPRNLLVSRETGLIWLVLLALIVLTLWESPILYRIAATPLVLGLIGWALRGMWSRNTGQSSPGAVVVEGGQMAL